LWHGKEAGKGSVNLEPIKKGMFSVCSYLTDYLTKQSDDEKFRQRKSFFTSRELNKPEQYYDSDAMQVFEQVEKSAKKESRFEHHQPVYEIAKALLTYSPGQADKNDAYRKTILEQAKEMDKKEMPSREVGKTKGFSPER
jgi:hypothetical protein